MFITIFRVVLVIGFRIQGLLATHVHMLLMVMMQAI